MSPRPDIFEALLANQLEMNPTTWTHLQARGVDESTLLILDFFYTAPGRSQAQALAGFLLEETTFSAQAVSERTHVRKRWRVIGATRPSTTSVDMLNDWVTFMVRAGASHGGCHFDGWGVQVPDVADPDTLAEADEPARGRAGNGSVGALSAERRNQPRKSEDD